MKEEIILIDLFSGIGGFAKGLSDAGFKIKEHYFSEIDIHAIANYKYNFPHAKYIGNIKFIQYRDFGRNAVITFGSPCQDFSLAGKRRGLGGERSSLIEQALSAVSNIRPYFFIWENVKGAYSSNNSEDFWAIIKAFADLDGYRFEKQLVNTSWLLPQNRERIYLVGHLTNRCGPEIFPIRKNTERAFKGALETTNTRTLTAGGNSGGLHSSMTLVKSATKSGYEVAKEGDSINLSNPNSETRRGRVGKGVAQTLDCACNQAVMIGAMRGRNPENPKSRKPGLATEQMLELNEKGIANTLTSVQKDNVVIQMNKSKESGGKQPYQQNRIYAKEGLSPCVDQSAGRWKIGTFRTHKDGQGFRQVSDGNSPTIPARAREDGSGQPVIQDESSIRRLTEIECERLQGFPDNHTKYGMYLSKKVEKYIFGKNKKWRTEKATHKLFVHAVNNTELVKKEIPATQRYKMCGNAVTAKMVEVIGGNIKKNLQNVE